MSLWQSTSLVRVILVAVLSCVSALAQGSAGIAQTRSDDSRDRYYARVEPTTSDRSNAERLFTLYDTARYAEFDAVANALALSFPNPFEFEADAESWIAAATDRSRRSFVVATVALELASRQLVLHPRRSLPFTNTVHHMNFVLAEIGCAFLRDHPPCRWSTRGARLFVALARRTRSPFQINAPLPASDRSGAGLAKYDARTFARQLREHDELIKRLRRAATRVSPSTGIDASRLSAQHGLHLQARFPNDPLPTFLDAFDRDGAWAFMFETLLTSRHSPVWLDAAQAEQIAQATVLHIIAVHTAAVAGGGPAPARSSSLGFMRDQPTKAESELFEALPALTGGAFHGPRHDSGVKANVDVVEAVRDVLHDFRQSYVIQYQPRDVTTSG